MGSAKKRRTSRKAPEKPLGSTEWWLPLIGTLTPQEGAAIRAAITKLFEQVEDLD